MQLYLLRHGAAEDNNASGDSARKLTDQGRAAVTAVVATARRGGMEAPLILSSPYVRAMETAAIAGEFTVIDSLVPHGSPERVWSDVRDYPDEPAVLLVGHEPLMGHLAGWLLGSPALQVEMKKSALVRIDLGVIRARPSGILRWMLTPALCR